MLNSWLLWTKALVCKTISTVTIFVLLITYAHIWETSEMLSALCHHTRARAFTFFPVFLRRVTYLFSVLWFCTTGLPRCLSCAKMICRGRNLMWLDVKIDPNLFVRCRLTKICFRLFELAQYCTHIQYHSNVSWQSRLETQFSILKVFENQESSFEAWVSIFEVREPSFEFQGTRRIIRGSRTVNSRKAFNSQKQNNSDEQNNWRAALFAETHCWMNANIFSLCAFSTKHTRFAYLHWSWWQQTSLASKCVYNISAETSNFFLCEYSECVVFISATSTGRSKRKQMLTAKKCFFFTKPAWRTKVLICFR